MAQLLKQKVKGSDKLWRVFGIKLKDPDYGGADHGEIKVGGVDFYVRRRPRQESWFVGGFEKNADVEIFGAKKKLKKGKITSTASETDDWYYLDRPGC